MKGTAGFLTTLPAWQFRMPRAAVAAPFVRRQRAAASVPRLAPVAAAARVRRAGRADVASVRQFRAPMSAASGWRAVSRAAGPAAPWLTRAMSPVRHITATTARHLLRPAGALAAPPRVPPQGIASMQGVRKAAGPGTVFSPRRGLAAAPSPLAGLRTRGSVAPVEAPTGRGALTPAAEPTPRPPPPSPLDGRLMGRWLSDQLADAVLRPLSGVSSMDERLTPVFPGTSFG